MHSDPIIRRMHACVLAGVPVCLWGESGEGKTVRTKAYAKARGLHLERWLLSRVEPIDLKPRIYQDGQVVVCDAPELARLTRHGGGLLFLDELNRAMRETEGAALDIMDAPPPNVSVVAACNPPSRGQAARSLGAAAANRFCHLEVDADAIVWSNAQIGGWPELDGELPIPAVDAIARAEARARALVSAFIRKVPAALQKCPDNPVDAGKAWPSTRTWEHARVLLTYAMALDLDLEDTRKLVAGCVGDGPAVEFISYVQDADLPDPEDLLAKPKEYMPDPARIDRTIAAMTAVAGAVERRFTDARWCAGWELIHQCVRANVADAGIVGADLLMAAYKRLGKRDEAAKKALTNPAQLMPQRLAEILV